VMELKLPGEYKEKTNLFNQQEIKVPVKGENFLSPYIGDGVRYFFTSGWTGISTPKIFLTVCPTLSSLKKRK
ncbi:hypothetical protein KU620_24090, partial [Salmonella enterica subsp. enterica serovar Mbandaka]|nr:hypothetical protein [Salmonella enterica subsp. enterica serovar Mbandaka]